MKAHSLHSAFSNMREINYFMIAIPVVSPFFEFLGFKSLATEKNDHTMAKLAQTMRVFRIST